MTIRFDKVGKCPSYPTMLVEGYTPREGRAHGSLDVTVRCCADHHQKYRDEINACGMTAFSFTGSVVQGERGGVTTPLLCGDRTIFDDNEYISAHKGSPYR
jgi:hypothetical protein